MDDEPRYKVRCWIGDCSFLTETNDLISTVTGQKIGTYKEAEGDKRVGLYDLRDGFIGGIAEGSVEPEQALDRLVKLAREG